MIDSTAPTRFFFMTFMATTSRGIEYGNSTIELTGHLTSKAIEAAMADWYWKISSVPGPHSTCCLSITELENNNEDF